ncbi:MAG: hypothetical protein ABIW79_01855, partial [Gemmatimonas sp.]
YVVGEPKVYRAGIRFGFETDTDDSTGSETAHATAPDLSRRAELQTAIELLTGAVQQTPPAFSAKHVNGQRAYALARKGAHVDLASVTVLVHSWSIRGVDADRLEVEITCAGGTYIRALARDLGRAMHSAAHCESLRREASGPARVLDAVTLERLAPGSIADGVVPLRPPLPLLGDVAHEPLNEVALRDVLHGRAVSATVPGARAALLHGDRIVAIATRTADERWQPTVVLAGVDA